MSDHEEQSIEERRERLKNQAERKTKMNKAEQWEPAAGEVLEGEYLGSRVATTQYGEVPVYYVDPFDGDPKSVLGRTSMKMEMDQADPTSGDLIMVTFEGMQTSEDARGEFYAFSVVTE